MRTIDCDWTEIPQVLADLVRQQVKHDLRTLEEKILLEASLSVQRRAVRLTNKAGLVHLGAYKLAWRTPPNRVSGGYDVTNATPYAGVLELGRRPKRKHPPLGAIREWVERKLLPNGRVQLLEGETLDQALDRVALAIQRKIHHKGTPPHHILRRSLEKVPNYIQREVRRHLPTQLKG